MKILITVITATFLLSGMPANAVFDIGELPEAGSNADVNPLAVNKIPRDYVKMLNEQTRATKLLLKSLGKERFVYSPESLVIGHKIEMIVEQTYTLAFNQKTGKIDTEAWHQFTDIAINQMAHSMKSDVIGEDTHNSKKTGHETPKIGWIPLPNDHYTSV